MMKKDLKGQGGVKSETTKNMKAVSRKNQRSRIGTKRDKASVGGMSSLDSKYLDKDETGMVSGTTEPEKDGTSTLEPPST